jgi:hypothetical protein
MPRSLELLLRTELEEAIIQANLGNFDTVIAKKYLIEQVPQIDIAEELGYGRTTITERMPRIYERVERAAQRLFGHLENST